MTDRAAIRALIEAVEGGIGYLGVLNVASPVAASVGDGGLYAFIVDAYGGSLDAADAFRAIALPGWDWQVGTFGKSSASVSMEGRGTIGCLEMDCTPARALLLAILKAMEAEAAE